MRWRWRAIGRRTRSVRCPFPAQLRRRRAQNGRCHAPSNRSRGHCRRRFCRVHARVRRGGVRSRWASPSSVAGDRSVHRHASRWGVVGRHDVGRQRHVGAGDTRHPAQGEPVPADPSPDHRTCCGSRPATRYALPRLPPAAGVPGRGGSRSMPPGRQTQRLGAIPIGNATCCGRCQASLPGRRALSTARRGGAGARISFAV